MTQEESFYWPGKTLGDATLAPYSASEWTNIWRKMHQADRTTQSVIAGHLNEMLVTNPAGSTIRVASGAALVDGTFYENTANVDFTVSTPASDYYYYRVIIRKNPTLQTTRLALIGPNASTYPSVSQVDSGLWEVSIARIKVDSAAVITIYEGRRFCGSPLGGKNKLMEIVLTAASSIVELGEIPQVYHHLQLVGSGYPTVAGTHIISAVINGDVGANYDTLITQLKGDSTEDSLVTPGTDQINLAIWGLLDTNYRSGFVTDFVDYRSSKYKTIFSRGGEVALGGGITSNNFLSTNHWKSTGAINKIEVVGIAFPVGSTFTLYGWN
jgi:hypothetical protein